MHIRRQEIIRNRSTDHVLPRCCGRSTAACHWRRSPRAERQTPTRHSRSYSDRSVASPATSSGAATDDYCCCPAVTNHPYYHNQLSLLFVNVLYIVSPGPFLIVLVRNNGLRSVLCNVLLLLVYTFS